MDESLPSRVKGDDRAAPRGCVLVVEDDAAVSSTIAEMLEQLGYAATVCTQAEEGFNLAQAQPFDLLIVDYRMPHMTGLDLISMLRAEGCEVPVIVMTGYAATGERISCERSGEFPILKKPFTSEALAKALQGNLKPSQAVRAGQITVSFSTKDK